MDISIFLKGIVIGFAMAVPVGPIGIMCIRKTLTDGRARGLIVGLGAATADFIYGCIAAFGLTMISEFLSSQRVWIRLSGGALLLLIGVKTFLARPLDPNIPINSTGKLRSFLTTAFLTLTNPITIFAFIALFAALGLGEGLSYYSASALVIGVFIGSALWFLLLSSGVTLFRKRLNLNALKWVNKIAGILIIISGLIAIGSLI